MQENIKAQYLTHFQQEYEQYCVYYQTQVFLIYKKLHKNWSRRTKSEKDFVLLERSKSENNLS